jgi:hypothetical protein
MHQEKISYLYLIDYSILPFCKIGISTNPESRLSDLQVANPVHLLIVATWKFENSEDARKAEDITKEKFKEDKHRGEWYKGTPKNNFWGS